MLNSEEPLNETTIPEESAERQEVIPFQGDEFAAALTATGNG